MAFNIKIDGSAFSGNINSYKKEYAAYTVKVDKWKPGIEE